MRGRNHLWLVIVLLSLIAAFFIGKKIENFEESERIQIYLSIGEEVRLIEDDIWEIIKTKESIIGYLSIGKAQGYGGDLYVLIRTNIVGEIQQIRCIRHSETSSYFEKVTNKGFLNNYLQKTVHNSGNLAPRYDGVSGASVTSYALDEATRNAMQNLGEKVLGSVYPNKIHKQYKFNAIDIILLTLFLLGIVARRLKFKYQKILRYISILLGIVLIGFYYNKALNISIINKLLLGFWPEWQTQLYWYILVFGIIILVLISDRNPYCNWFCPFGGVQDMLGKLGKAKSIKSIKLNKLLKQVPKFLAWGAIILALLFRNPSISGYEVFSAIFDFNASGIMFIMLGIVLIVSLFIYRPWCNYLCPVDPAISFIRKLKRLFNKLEGSK